MAIIKTKAITGAKPIVLPHDASPEWISVDVDFPAAALAVNDIILLCGLYAGLKVLDWAIIFPDVDSGGSPAFATSLGVALNDGSDLSAEVWATGITAGQTTTIVRNTTNVPAQSNPAGLATQYAADGGGERQVALKVTSAAATYAGAGKTGQVLLLVQG